MQRHKLLRGNYYFINTLENNPHLYNGYSTDLDAFLFRDSKGNKRFILENELKNFNITHVSYKKVYSVMQKENNNVQS